MELLKTTIGRLRIIAFLEGTSLLLILFITMPLKYIFEYPQANMVVGMSHGVLFLLYILAIIQAKIEFEWSLKTFFIAGICSIIPFGTFWADKKIFNTDNANINTK